MTATRIYTYDSTLRDGEQCEGITLSLADKLAIVRRLDEFGIDYIEGGFPASNPKDVAFFREVAAMDLKHAQIAAFGSTCKKGVAAADDPGLADLIACGAPASGPSLSVMSPHGMKPNFSTARRMGALSAWVSMRTEAMPSAAAFSQAKANSSPMMPRPRQVGSTAQRCTVA